MDRSLLSDGVLENKMQNKLIFFKVSFEMKPSFLFFLCINDDLSYTAWRNDVKLPVTKFSHVLRSQHIQRCSQLVEIINICMQDSNNAKQEATDTIAFCVDKLNSVLKDAEDNIQSKAAFLIEQLCLLSKGSNNRRYSPDLIASATSWLLNSPSLYNQLRLEVLTLPVPNYVKRLTQAINVDFGLSKTTEIYLKTRFNCLPNERDKIVSIILDEVYAASNVEFVGGKFFGCENGSQTKTLLCTMIKSIAGRYHDVVTLTPLTCINSGIILKVYMTLLKTVVEIGFDVTVTLVDGHSSNCKFFKDELCSGMLNCSINNPLKSQNRIFLLFDPVHLFKNFYNNFINKKFFECPNFENEIIKSNIEHITEIYNIELGKSVKIAHRLSDKVLAPASIEKSNVSLADSIFHESTIAALQFYAVRNNNPEYNHTANFLKLIRRWWNLLNIKSEFSGQAKLDANREPINSSNLDRLQFLKSFVTWLQDWENSDKHGLSKETFLCAKQTSSSMAELIPYLLNERKLNFVLTAKLQSDQLEGRFGRYRRSAGTNYFISVRQILEAEKAIRIQSLVSIDGLNVKEIQEIFSEISAKKSLETEVNSGLITEYWHENRMEFSTLLKGDEGIKYYCAGFVARSLIKSTTCQDCKKILIADINPPNIVLISDGEMVDTDTLKRKETFLQSINRGGLCTASDLVYIACSHVFNFHEKIFGDAEFQKLFLSLPSPRDVFINSMILLVEEREWLVKAIFESTCDSGHPFRDMFPAVAKCIFNICSKNFCSEKNSIIHKGKKRKTPSISSSKQSKNAKKIAKLQK